MKRVTLYLCFATTLLLLMSCSPSSEPEASEVKAAESSLSKYGKYVVTELIMPEEKQKIDAEYSKYANRILWMDENVVEGAFIVPSGLYVREDDRGEAK